MSSIVEESRSRARVSASRLAAGLLVAAIEVDHSVPGGRVVRVLERLAELHGLLEVIRIDNGTELTSHTTRSGRTAPSTT